MRGKGGEFFSFIYFLAGLRFGFFNERFRGLSALEVLPVFEIVLRRFDKVFL